VARTKQNLEQMSLRDLRLHSIFPLKIGLTDGRTLCQMLYNPFKVHSHFSLFELLFNAQCSICLRLFRFYYAHLQLYSSCLFVTFSANLIVQFLLHFLRMSPPQCLPTTGFLAIITHWLNYGVPITQTYKCV
jgi:hypothetical protein